MVSDNTLVSYRLDSRFDKIITSSKQHCCIVWKYIESKMKIIRSECYWNSEGLSIPPKPRYQDLDLTDIVPSTAIFNFVNWNIFVTGGVRAGTMPIFQCPCINVIKCVCIYVVQLLLWHWRNWNSSQMQ